MGDELNYGTVRVINAFELDREMDKRPGWRVISVNVNSFGGMGYLVWIERIKKVEKSVEFQALERAESA
jgi:hypothetical protein